MDVADSDRSAVEQDPTVRLSIGDETVAATRYEPTDVEGPSPAVLWYTPYHKDDETTFGRYDPLLSYVAAHGYEVVVADMVGTGASTGQFGELLGPDTGAEVAAVVERVAEQPWTTGRVGMLGKSFPGGVCLACAAENPDPLEAIVPILTTYRREREAFSPGGLPSLWLPISILALYGAISVQPPSRRDPGWDEVWQERLDGLREEGPPLARVLDPDPADPYWDWSIPVEDVRVPTFAVGGYRDHFSTDTLEYFDAIDAPKRLLMGPWRHVTPFRGRESAVGFRGQVVDWFDRFLKGEGTCPEEAGSDPFEPTIAHWTGRDGGREPGAGTWRGRASWPALTDAEPLSFAATPSGLRRAEAFDARAVERTHEVDHTTGLEAQDFAVPYVDTNADDARSTTFDTGPFDHPVELTGTGEARVRLDADGSLPLVVRLVDVAPDGRARPLTRGSLRVEAGESGPVAVSLAPVSHVVEADHRLRLAIAGADFPSHVPVGTVESFAVTSTPDAPTVVRMPGRDPAPESFEDAVAMAPPDDSFPLAPPAVEATETSQETTREHVRGSATRHHRVATDFAFPHVEKTYEMDVEASVLDGDPETLDATATIETTLEHDDDPVAVASTVRRTPTGGSLATTVRVDGEVVFDEEWTS